jgi:cell division protein FtsB
VPDFGKLNFKAMTFSEWWTEMKMKKWLKYVITLVVFLIVYLFIGDQSLLQFARRGREIRHLEQQRDMYREGSENAQRELRTLSHPDSLERFAREHYYMHAPDEDIYLIDN